MSGFAEQKSVGDEEVARGSRDSEVENARRTGSLGAYGALKPLKPGAAVIGIWYEAPAGLSSDQATDVMELISVPSRLQCAFLFF